MRGISTPGLIRLGAVAVAVGSVVATFGGWVGLDIVQATVSATPVVRMASEPTQDLLESVDETLGEVRAALVTMGTISGRLATSSTEAAGVVSEVGDLASGPLAETLEALEEALPALIDTAAVIDDTMRTLSVLGVEYRPTVPLDEALAEIDTQLDGLPATLRLQGDRLGTLADEIRVTGTDTDELTLQIETTGARLAEVQITLGEYDEALAELDRLTDLGDRIDSSIPIARVALILTAVMGLALGVVGWRVADRLAAQTAQVDG